MINKRVKTPNYLQMEAVECGAACLQIILAYYNCYQSLEHLRELCGVSRDGVCADNIIKAAQCYGLSGEGLLAELEEGSIDANLAQLCEVPFPYIIFWEFKHFVVLEGIKGQRLFINDPACGRYSVDYSTFSKKFTGVVLSFTRTEAFKPYGKPSQIWPGLWQRIKPERGHLINAIVISLLLIIPGVLLPGLTKIFIDNILIDHQEGWIIPFLWAFGTVAFLELILIWMQRKALLYLQINLAMTQGKRFFKHLFSLPMSFFDQRLPGDICNRLEANDRIAQMLSGETSVAMVSLVSLLFYAVIMALLSLSLTLINLVTMVLQLTLNQYFSKSLAPRSKLYQQQKGQLMGIATSGLSLIETLKLQGLENDYFNRIDSQREQTSQTWQQLWLHQVGLMVLPKILILLNAILVLAVGVQLVLHGHLSIGSLVAFSLLMASFQQPMEVLAGTVLKLKTIEGDLSRIDDVFEYPIPSLPEKESKTTPGEVLSFKQVSFGYHRLSPPLLDNLSFELKRGHSLAIVGKTGSGKSTLLNCLTGLYLPWKGSILLDDIPIYQLTKKCRSDLIAVVSQNCGLFAGTLRDNLTMGDVRISEQDMFLALKQTHVYEEVMGRGGLQAPVSSLGRNFSGGQVQRIELARALLRKPHFLVLDEATSALDNASEAAVIAELKKLDTGIVLAAHRLSTVSWCECILFMEEGKIIESGSHAELMAKGGKYWQLVQSEENNHA